MLGTCTCAHSRPCPRMRWTSWVLRAGDMSCWLYSVLLISPLMPCHIHVGQLGILVTSEKGPADAGTCRPWLQMHMLRPNTPHHTEEHSRDVMRIQVEIKMAGAQACVSARSCTTASTNHPIAACIPGRPTLQGTACISGQPTLHLIRGMRCTRCGQPLCALSGPWARPSCHIHSGQLVT